MAYKDKTAQAVCTFAYCQGPGHEPLIFEGRTTVSQDPPSVGVLVEIFFFAQGKIVPARGPTNFGMSEPYQVSCVGWMGNS